MVLEEHLVVSERTQWHVDVRQCRRIGTEALSQDRHVGQLASREQRLELSGELRFTAALMRQAEQLGGPPAGGAFAKLSRSEASAFSS